MINGLLNHLRLSNKNEFIDNLIVRFLGQTTSFIYANKYKMQFLQCVCIASISQQPYSVDSD